MKTTPTDPDFPQTSVCAFCGHVGPRRRKAMITIPTGEKCYQCDGEMHAWDNADGTLTEGQPVQCQSCGANGQVTVYQDGSIGVIEVPDEGNTVKCWSCDGTGIACRAAMNTANVDIPCDRCKGTGECLHIMREWESWGLAYRLDRQGADQTLRERAKQIGCSVVELSQAERGIINPRCIYSANAERSNT